MHEVINVYGKTILQAIILVGVMWLVFRGVTDENGNKGIVEIVSGHMDRQTENPADFETFYEESQSHNRISENWNISDDRYYKGVGLCRK